MANVHCTQSYACPIAFAQRCCEILLLCKSRCQDDGCLVLGGAIVVMATTGSPTLTLTLSRILTVISKGTLSP